MRASASNSRWAVHMRKSLSEGRHGAVFLITVRDRKRAEEIADHFAVEIKNCASDVRFSWPDPVTGEPTLQDLNP